jgi:hypothetical protein
MKPLRSSLLALVLAASACRTASSPAPFVVMRPLAVPTPADAPCDVLARDLRAHGEIILVSGSGVVVPPDETLIVRHEPPAPAGTQFEYVTIFCMGRDPLTLKLRMCVDGKHTFGVIAPESLRAFADEASPSSECELYDPSLSYLYAHFLFRRGSRALIAEDDG